VRLLQLEYFVTIADEGSYANASTLLTIAQPSLSQQISSLEKELGAQLFERLPRGVRLTPTGRAFLPEARSCVESARRARRVARAAANLETGGLEIATVGSMAIGILPNAINRWHRAHPGTAMTVTSYRHPDQLEQAVLSGVSDLAIGPTPQRWAGEQLPLGEEEFVVVLPVDDPLAGNEVIDLADLADRNWVTFERDHGLSEYLTTACAQAGFIPRPAAQLAEVGAALRLAITGLGPTLLPANVIPPRIQVSVARLRQPLRRSIAAYTRDRLSHGARAFLPSVRRAIVRNARTIP